VQLLVYVGGILVLTLFAVMLTHRISDVNVSNRAVGRLPAAVLVGIAFAWMVHVAGRARWVVKDPGAPAPTTYGIGNAFLRQYALPFEIASLVLLAALIGAIFVIMLAAAEAAIGLAIVLGIYQSFETIDVEATDRLRQ